MATMHDVARLAQVSVSTVSYVLTGTRPISQATRNKVLAAMAQLDYQPNAAFPLSGADKHPHDPRASQEIPERAPRPSPLWRPGQRNEGAK